MRYTIHPLPTKSITSLLASMENTELPNDTEKSIILDYLATGFLSAREGILTVRVATLNWEPCVGHAQHLYFESQGNKKLKFSRYLNMHNRTVRKYLLNDSYACAIKLLL